MKRCALLGLILVAVLWSPSRALAGQTPVPTTDVRAMLAESHWRPDAIDWAIATVDVYLDPASNLGNPFYTGGAYYARYAANGPYPAKRPYVVLGRMGHPFTLDHEMHHAWDDEHEHQTDAGRKADMDRLALDQTLAGAWAREVLENPAADNGHYMHFLLTKASGDPMAYPAWFRQRYFGYLVQRDKRTILPVAVR